MTKTIVKVAVPRPIWATYDYEVPDNLMHPQVGSRVRVPFGAGRTIGIVLAISNRSEFKTRPVLQVLDEQPLIGTDLLDLAQWMSKYYHHPIGSVINTMLPTLARRGKGPNIAPEFVWSVNAGTSVPKFKNARKQAEVYGWLASHGPASDSEVKQEKINRRVLRALVNKELVVARESIIKHSVTPPHLPLTDEQKNAVNEVTQTLGSFKVHLLNGVTGSGKTEVYLRVIEEVLQRGQQVLVLVPEISLTPQTTERFDVRFTGVATMHSMISDAARFATWTKTATGETRILVGTRSAVFTPFKNLGLIVIDEEHDTSYKQTDSLRYSGRDVGIKRASALGVPCVLGSATPSLESVANVIAGRYNGLALSHRPGTAEMPSFYVQDIRGLILDGGMSQPLLDNIRKHIHDDGQVLILINRRGYAPSYFCSDCGWRAKCDSCDVFLTLHESPFAQLQCHHCGTMRSVPVTCPECDKRNLLRIGAGTQRIEQTLREQFTDVPIYRIDRDEVRTHRKMKTLFAHLRNSDRGILIGTQMLAKGHHFPNVTFVAVLAADGGFLTSDFRGPERTAQLVVQVAGRAGRAERGGEVWIQSFDPENPHLVSLVTDGYQGFISAELSIRRSACLPPYHQMAVIRADGLENDRTQRFIGEILDRLEKFDVELLGPSQAPISRISKNYRYQGIVLASSRQNLHRALRSIERMTTKTKNIHWSIDVDPVDMF